MEETTPEKQEDNRTKRHPIDKHVLPAKQDPAQERGERLETGRAIARGGKESGEVPGSESDKKQ